MRAFVSTLLIALFIASVPGLIWAHGGGHSAEPKQKKTKLPELPNATIDIKTTQPGTVDYGMGDPMDSFEMEEVDGNGPLWGEEPQPAGETSEHEGHDMSQMQHVKPAEHEWISTSQKGYGWAAALTVLSGALFGFLSLRRPCE